MISSNACSWISILSKYQRLLLCRIRVREKLLQVSDNRALINVIPSLRSPFQVSWQKYMKTNAAENICTVGMLVRRVSGIGVSKTPNELQSKICMVIEKQNLCLLQKIFALLLIVGTWNGAGFFEFFKTLLAIQVKSGSFSRVGVYSKTSSK